MRFLSKKGQTATEYLIILAVVIVIALIVVGVMRGVPGIGKGGKSGVADAYWSTAPIGITQAGISAGATTDTIVLKNNQASGVTVTSVTLGGSANMLSGNEFLESGESRLITSAANIACTAGNSYSFAVNITYTVQATGASFTDASKTYEGVCAN